MQSVVSGWTAESRDSVRSIEHTLQVSWKKFSTLGNRTFTIGVSLIGGTDVIGQNPGAIGSPGNYQYFDESSYVLGMAWERGLHMPTGGLAKSFAEADLDNTSGRFLPRYMGGSSELYTAMINRRPFIIQAGFEVAGVPQVLPKFAGITDRPPVVDVRNRRVKIHGADYTDYFSSRYLDHEVMFTDQFTDTVMENMLSGSLGLATSQYELDQGINKIPFGLFPKGTKYNQIFNELAEAENGHFYQDENGIFRFENRQHWDSSPYTDIQRVIYTSQVINAQAPDTEHLINVIEINAPIYKKQPVNTIFTLPLGSVIEVPGNSEIYQFIEFVDPALSLTKPTASGTDSYYFANSSTDGTGTNMTSSISFTTISTFARAVKYRITNSSASTAYITQLQLSGRVAKKVGDLYYREQDDSSVTAYEERNLSINNPYIQNESWAGSLSRLLLNDFSSPENIQTITIRALPELQLGDLVSWQGRYWRIYDIKAKLTPEEGFVQELTMIQRTITSYFRIGISTIGGTDRISP